MNNEQFQFLMRFLNRMADDDRLNTSHVSLCFALVICWNDQKHKSPFKVSRKILMDYSHSIVLTDNNKDDLQYEGQAAKSMVKASITDALRGFYTYPLLGKGETWYSRTEVETSQIANEFKSYSWYPGFYSGLSGVSYCLGVADHQGYDLGDNRDVFYSNLDKAIAHFTINPSTKSGFLTGSAGFCVSFAQLIRQGIIQKDIANFNFISCLLDQPNKALNLANGIAGQALAKILCADFLEFPAFTEGTADIVSQLLREQNSDGSWSIKKDDNAKKGVKQTGLFYGIAGIAYLLLVYGVRYYSEESEAAALKSLNWLLNCRRLIKAHDRWPVNSKNPAVDPWLEFGFTGIAWVFVKAFEYLHDPRFEEAAKSALYSHPRFIASNYLSQASGLAGLGEVYLEAYRVFKEKEWLDRASHIASVLIHCTHEQADGSLYWLDGSDNLPTADFMNGNSGILHFLLRFNNPEKVGFHLFSI